MVLLEVWVLLRYSLPVTLGRKLPGYAVRKNLEWVKSLGADRVIDYTKEDFTKRGERYDLIFDAVGKISKSKCRKALNPNGIYMNVGMARKDRAEDLTFLTDLIEAGKLKSVIDRSYPLEQIPRPTAMSKKGTKREMWS